MKSKTHLRKALLGVLLISGLAASSFGANVQIASFANGSFTLDGTSTYAMTSTPSGITGNGEIDFGNAAFGSWSGFISPATSNWSAYEGYNLLMSVSGTNPELAFSVYFASGAEDVAAFTATTTGVGNSLMSVLLTWDAADPNNTVTSLAQLTDVNGFGITWNGNGPSTGGASIGITLAGIEAIPEPSSASLVLLGAAGLVALRRLRKV